MKFCRFSVEDQVMPEANTSEEQLKRLAQRQDDARKAVFDNEKFAISVLQIVSGGSIIGAFNQFGELVKTIGLYPVKIFLTFMIIALVSAVLAAYCRHQYKMWDLKCGSASSQQNTETAIQYEKYAGRNLKNMRRLMQVSVIIICMSFAVVASSLWFSLKISFSG